MKHETFDSFSSNKQGKQTGKKMGASPLLSSASEVLRMTKDIGAFNHLIFQHIKSNMLSS